MEIKRVHKLPEDVINKIKAGEVVSRPVNAVKELIENSLDAGATRIIIKVKDGGKSMIQVQDNGKGIHKNDLEIVCERHTTSKLDAFEDLLNMKTFGFRGEALSAISIASHLTITSRISESACGYQMEYLNKKALQKEPKALAANPGTIVTMENLFCNMLLRKNSLKSASEEYNLIVDLITKYAIHFSNFVSFTLLKEKESSADVYTSAESQTLENIKLLYGKDLANDLTAIAANSSKNIFQVTGFISNVNYSAKKLIFILFINDRLVECSPLKKSISLVYTNYLSKGTYPFVYISLKMDPSILDVNVHPAKKEVRFLYDEHIFHEITSAIELKLASTTNSKSIETNQLINSSFKSTSNKSNLRSNPSEKVRTDSKYQKLEEVWSRHEISKSTGSNNYKRKIELTSILQLLKEVKIKHFSHLRNILKNSCFVGCVSEKIVLIQHETQLVVLNIQKLSQELFYQLYLENFGNFGYIHFDQPQNIKDLLSLYYKAHPPTPDSKTPDQVCELLNQERIRAMADDYFSLIINEKENITAIPLLLNGHSPNIYKLPNFIYHLGHHVNWNKEKDCFKDFGQALADFYSQPSYPFSANHEDWKNVIQFILYPKIKEFLQPSLKMEEHIKIATKLSDLYKIFERC